MAYAELAALRPRAGGEYVYLREAFGPPAAFLTGWTSFVAGFSGAIATSAAVMVFYLGRFAPGVAGRAPWLVVPIVPGVVVLTLSAQTMTAVAVIAAMAWLHLRGVGPGRVVGKPAGGPQGDGARLLHRRRLFVWNRLVRAPRESAPVAPAGWLLALIPVMFTYSGWNAAAYVAEEVRDPGRNVPRALALGTGAVIAIYLLLNALYLYVIPAGELATIKGSVLDVIADRLLGGAAGNIMGVVSIVSLAASISAMTFAGPRVYYAMARDGLFFSARGRRAPALPHAGRGDRRAGDLELAARADGDGRRARQLHRLSRSCCFQGWRWWRCSCCGGRSPTPSGRSARGAIRSRRRSTRSPAS